MNRQCEVNFIIFLFKFILFAKVDYALDYTLRFFSAIF